MTDSTTRPPRTPDWMRPFMEPDGGGLHADTPEDVADFLSKYHAAMAEAAAPDAGLREALALALHQSRRSNDDPEYDTDVARERVDRMLANPHLRAALAAPHPAPAADQTDDFIGGFQGLPAPAGPAVDPTCAIQPGCQLPLDHKGPHEWPGILDPNRYGAAGPAVDVDEYMCPNCVTPWKCNGPHIPDPTGDAE